MKIDELDLKLLALLSKNGRISSAEMARIVSVSERTVSNHVTNLIENGVISICGIVNRQFFGYDVVADVYCLVEDADMEEVAKEIGKFPEVSYVAISFGDRDISVQVFCKSTEEVKDFVLKKLSRLPGIGRTTTVILPTVIKEITEWNPVEVEMIGEEQAQKR
jgi:Lrp/AsnC family transcriptional regulator for asnA, asnC and gidA